MSGCAASRTGRRCGKRILLFRDHRKGLTGVTVYLDVLLLVRREICVHEDGVYGTLGDAAIAVYADLWVDVEHVGPLMEAIHRADFYTVRVLASSARVNDDIGHNQNYGYAAMESSNVQMRRSQPKRSTAPPRCSSVISLSRRAATGCWPGLPIRMS